MFNWKKTECILPKTANKVRMSASTAVIKYVLKALASIVRAKEKKN